MISIQGLKKSSIACLITAASLAVVSLGDDSQGFPNLSDLAKSAKEFNLDIPSTLNASDFPSIDEGERQIKEKCMKNGLNTSYDDYLAQREVSVDCIKGLFNFTQLQNEIAEKKPTGELDVVFRKYCHKSPILKGCVLNFTTAVEPCLEESEKALKNTVQNITDALLNFVCFKEGDKIALFIAEGGPSCISEKNEAIQQCVNATLSKYVPSDLGEETVLPLLKLGEQECQDVFELQDCLVKELETCEEPTPANIIDSLFTFVYKQTPCNSIRPRKGKGEAPNEASFLHVFTHLFLLVLSIHFWRS